MPVTEQNWEQAERETGKQVNENHKTLEKQQNLLGSESKSESYNILTFKCLLSHWIYQSGV